MANCSGGALAMADLFKEMSGEVGFIFFIVIMTLITISTFIIFFESVNYIDKKIPASRRRVRLHIVLFIFPFISWNALFSLYMPRSHMITYFTSTIYFSLALYQFLYLIFDYFGGKQALLEILKDKTIPLAGPPLTCCCYCCIPPLPMTPRNLMIVKRLVLQTAVLRPLVLYIALIAWSNGTYIPGNLRLNSINLYIQLISLVSTMVALWGIIMLVRVAKGPLAQYRVTPKFLIVQLCLIVISLQAIVIAIFNMAGLIPCTTMFNSIDRGNYINDMLLIIEMFIFMVASRMTYRSREGNMGTLLDDQLPYTDPDDHELAIKQKEAEVKQANPNQNNNGVANGGYACIDETDVAVGTTEQQDVVVKTSDEGQDIIPYSQAKAKETGPNQNDNGVDGDGGHTGVKEADIAMVTTGPQDDYGHEITVSSPI